MPAEYLDMTSKGKRVYRGDHPEFDQHMTAVAAGLMNPLRRRIIHLRRRKGWSRRQLATAAGWSINYQTGLEMGNRLLGAPQIRIVAELLGVEEREMYPAKNPDYFWANLARFMRAEASTA